MVDMDIVEGILCFVILLCFISVGSFVIGYRNGFKKSKEIDDKIIDELTAKYKK